MLRIPLKKSGFSQSMSCIDARFGCIGRHPITRSDHPRRTSARRKPRIFLAGVVDSRKNRD
jgi:hypothetical protein